MKRKIMKNCPGCKELTIYFIIMLLIPLKYNVFENSMGNSAFDLLEQMLHFHNVFKSIQNLNFFQCCLKIEI